MSPHVDILDRPEALSKQLLGSVALHATIFGSLVLWGTVLSHHETWGDANSGGSGSVAINVVNKIPLPSRSGAVNPLANDTESSVPTPPPAPKAAKRAEPEEPDAIPVKGRTRQKTAPVDRSAQNTWRAKQQYQQNQLYSQVGPALVSPMVGQPGSGGVGIGPSSSPFGNRFGSYVAILRQRVAQNWHTGDVDPRIHSLPTAIVIFDLLRDGSVKNVHVAQSSGNSALDYSAQRAILDASPFPPLPNGYERSDATVEFWFELKR